MTMSKEPAGDDPRPPGDDADTRAPAPGVDVGSTAPANANDPDTHTAALQGAAAGGAMGGAAGYVGGVLTGSEDGIGVREIPDVDDGPHDGGAARAPDAVTNRGR